MIKLNIEDLSDFISAEEINVLRDKVRTCNESLYTKSGKGSDFLGWLDLPSKTTQGELSKINETASALASISDIIVVIGIGGSYLGARAVIDALSDYFPQLNKNAGEKTTLILYAGNNIGEDYHSDLLKVLDNYDYSLIVISKSGTTTEPAIAFRILREHIENKYGKGNSKKRIIVVTDKSKGALKKLAEAEGYGSFVIPDDVGGRYSVLTPVGLLPIAAAGFDTGKLIEGAMSMEMLCREKKSLEENPSDIYAAARNILYKKGKVIEILAGYSPNLNYLIEWWKQLFGESEGKEGKGIFPAGVNFTTDLHSLGQLIQDGMRNIFETVINIEQQKSELTIPRSTDNRDELNYISGKRLSEVNKMAMIGTKIAHAEGGVPNISINIPQINEYELGGLIYFFEKACSVSGYLLGVNPFNQPGVEAYKKKMFSLLGKPGET